MNECCANCKFNVKLQMWDYSLIDKGQWKFEHEGFVCLLFASEGTVIHMRGVNENSEYCECFTPKEEQDG